VRPRARRYLRCMTSSIGTATTTTQPAIKTRTVIAIAVLAPFLVFSLWVVANHGLFGFLTLARDEPWHLQVLLDLGIACTFGLSWVKQDARKRGITTTWPYYVATMLVGSVGLLAYAIRRGLPAR
jgi:hypothetical protein